MNFEMRIDNVAESRGSISVSGELLSGRFFGPEGIEVYAEGRKVCWGMIGSSGGSNLSGWPILPEHGSVLRLDLHGIPLGVVKTGMILVGIGFATESSAGRRLSNDWLETPAFWAIHFYMVMNEDDSEQEDLVPQLLGISMQEINDFYTQNISDQHSQLPWPYFSIRSPQGCVVEVEYAASEEFQTRFKIGDEQGLMTLGYWSGHQSLPAFRWPEIVALGNSFADEKMCAAVILLLLPAATVTPDQREVATAVLVQCLEAMQLFASGDRSRFARILIGHSVSEREWVNDPELGWIYENEYWRFAETSGSERTGLMGAMRPQTPHRSPRQAFWGEQREVEDERRIGLGEERG